MTWREAAAPVIAAVVREVGVQDPRALRRALTAAYPFGMRAGWPYKVWLSEVRRQVGAMRPRQGDLFANQPAG